MFSDEDKTFNNISQVFLSKQSSIDKITSAYEFAKSLHNGQKRKDGKLYISHPLEVALMLAKLDFDEDVVSGALLHDVVEDCNCTLQDIKERFGENVAELVDCVSAIDKAKFVFNNDDVYEDSEFSKASIEESSFKKLIEIGRKNPLGFCIKFADRLHNLRTIECFNYNKQLEKVKETEKWIIPIAKILKAEYFYRSIKNECFKIVHKFDGQMYFEQYKMYHSLNEKNIDSLQNKFQENFSSSSIKIVKIKNVREYKVYEDYNKVRKNVPMNKISQGQILLITNYNIFLLYENGKHIEVLTEVLGILNKRLSKDVKIIDAKIGNFTQKPYFQLEDRFKNKYNLYIMSTSDYIVLRNGTLNGYNSDLLDSENLDSLDEEYVKVFTRSGESKFLPKGSSVLDFAFKLHRDIGFGFKYALINKSPTKAPPYAKLYEGDKVEIVVEKNQDGEITNKANLKWFAYINTDLAKKLLIKYFEKHLN